MRSEDDYRRPVLIQIEFIDWIIKKFHTNVTKFDRQDLDEWIRINNLSQDDLDLLRDKILKNYEARTFPSLAVINKIWNDCQGIRDFNKGGKVFNYCTDVEKIKDVWNQWEIKNILKRSELIIKKIMEGEKISIEDREFHYIYGEVFCEYKTMVENEHPKNQIEKHINLIRERIENKKSFKSISANNKQNNEQREHKIVSAKKIYASMNFKE